MIFIINTNEQWRTYYLQKNKAWGVSAGIKKPSLAGFFKSTFFSTRSLTLIAVLLSTNSRCERNFTKIPVFLRAWRAASTWNGAVSAQLQIILMIELSKHAMYLIRNVWMICGYVAGSDLIVPLNVPVVIRWSPNLNFGCATSSSIFVRSVTHRAKYVTTLRAQKFFLLTRVVEIITSMWPSTPNVM